ncbi:hypothetical protein BBW68_06260 [Candidatus Erwinia dacicola]|uniref:Uncharacterized protein n=1 Tax=Candidatus Erwinia dacicola TaxID=252393 RepID=A0A1E7Z354_9GAMM|nr:hypothetical protein BBW68_06260 [Candidatus Erwinia dacicola]
MVSGRANNLIPHDKVIIRVIIMSMNKIVNIADALVKGWQVKIPAMKSHEWDELRWWLEHLRGYAH